MLRWYHLAFMIVSLALFGTGVSGTFLSIFRAILRVNTAKLLAALSVLFSVSCICSLASMNLIPFDPFRFVFDQMQTVYLLGYYIILSVPFFFSGLIMDVVLYKMTRERA